MSAVELHRCPSCGSDRQTKVDEDPVPGGTDWRHYECSSCGYEWRV